MNTIADAIRILENIEDYAPSLARDELESRLSDLENDAEILGAEVESLRGASISELDEHIDRIVAGAADLSRSIHDLYSEV